MIELTFAKFYSQISTKVQRISIKDKHLIKPLI